uniref:D-2-hydroxyglutarate dehydrogenase, mitochondrial n=1 Tax=Cacopsylla melanoneura TaxID=428564 RepID=A0A8D8LFC5_9HEMI
MLMRQFVRHMSAVTKSVERGSYTLLNDKHIKQFQHILSNDENRVITDEDAVKPYNTDWLKTQEGKSKLVLKPKTSAEMSAILRYCNEHKIAVCPQGGNTGVVAGGVPLYDEVIVSASLMNKIINFDELSGVLTCESGVVLETAEKFLHERGFIMPLDLGAKGSCQIGGNISTNAGGLRLFRYGSLHATVLGLEVVLADGTILDVLNTLKKDNTGYHLSHMFIGAEGTLGFVTKVVIQCPVKPNSTHVTFLGVDSFETVLEIVKLARSSLGEILSSCEMMDHEGVQSVSSKFGLQIPVKKCPFYMLLETSGSNQEHDSQKLSKFLEDGLEKNVILDAVMFSEESKIQKIWPLRERIVESCLKDGFIYNYDISVSLQDFYSIIPIMRERLKDQDVVTVCGYGHLGDGNLHVNISVREPNPAVYALVEPFIYEWTSQHKGSVSAEHGIGLAKKHVIHLSKNQTSLNLMRQIKQMMHPNNIMNPSRNFPRRIG